MAQIKPAGFEPLALEHISTSTHLRLLTCKSLGKPRARQLNGGEIVREPAPELGIQKNTCDSYNGVKKIRVGR